MWAPSQRHMAQAISEDNPEVRALPLCLWAELPVWAWNIFGVIVTQMCFVFFSSIWGWRVTGKIRVVFEPCILLLVLISGVAAHFLSNPCTPGKPGVGLCPRAGVGPVPAPLPGVL